MPEQLDYHSPTAPQTRRNWAVVIASLVCSGLSIVIAADVFIDALTIAHAGLFEPGVSFFEPLSLKVYHIQPTPLVWCFPVAGFWLGRISVRNGFRRLGWRSMVLSSISIVAMIAMDVYW